MTDIANVAQRDYWDTVAGPKWVRLGMALESRLELVNQLLLERARPVAGEHVLDIGCGTGPTTLLAATAVGPEGSVFGVDIAQPMLAVVRERVLASGLRNVTLELADAQVHRFVPGSIDLVISRFGVMFFEDPVAAFANVLAAIRPGGRLCFVCWSTLADNPHWQLPLDVVVRHLGPPSPKPERAPGPLAFSDASYVADILAGAGFSAVTVTETSCDLVGVTVEQETEFACALGPPGALVSEREPDAETLAVIRREIAAAIASFAKGDGIVLPAGLLVVEATRP